MTNRTVKVHSETIKEYCEKDKIKTPEIICDHDAEDRATLEENGIMTVKAEKDRLGGQQSVHNLFDNDRIFFFKDAVIETDTRRQIQKMPTCTEQEFGIYKWNNKGKEDMVKTKDDGMDCMRYAIHTYNRQNIGTSLSDIIKEASKQKNYMESAKFVEI